MRILAAYMLAVLGGNENPDAEAINTILGSVGIKAEAEQVELLLSELKGKNLDDVIKAGMERLSSVPSLGGGAAVAGGKVEEEKKEEEEEAPQEEEEEEESDEDMGFSLFD